MNQQMKRALRKELLQLQAAQHRQGLAQELSAFTQFTQTVADVALPSEGTSAWSGRLQLLLTTMLPNRWCKFLIYGLMFKKLADIWRAAPKQ